MTCAKGGWNPVGGGSTRQKRKNKKKTCAELGRRRQKYTSKEKKQGKDVCRTRQETTEVHVKREKTRKRRVQSSAGGDRSTRQKGNKKKTI